MNKNITPQYWMKICDQVAQASTCRVKIGTILIKQNQIVGAGYVGSISGDYHCNDLAKGCLLVDNHGEKGSGNSDQSCIRTVHAEQNAVLKCDVRGCEGNWIYCYSTYKPCLNCFKLLLQIGVKEFYYRYDYKDVNRDLYIQNLSRAITYGLIIKRLD